MPRLTLISDTHLAHRKGSFEIPDGDILVHAGDATYRGKEREILLFSEWFRSLPHRYKVFVAGNHDWGFQRTPQRAVEALGEGVHYLQDSEVVLEGVRIWGSPWQPEFCNWAFNLPRGDALRERWSRVPKGIDLLVTHGPPLGIGDRLTDGSRVGCADLREEILGRIRPRVHLSGHIHEGYGVREVDGVTFVNASLVDETYQIRNPAVVVDL